MVLCYITQPTKLFRSAVPILLFLSHWSCTRNKFDQLVSNSHEVLLQMTANDSFMVLKYPKNCGDMGTRLNPSMTENLTWILVSRKCLGKSDPWSSIRTQSHLEVNFEWLLFFCHLIVQVSGPMSLYFLMTMRFAPCGVHSLCTEKRWKNCLRTHCAVFVCTYVYVPVSSMYNLPFFFFNIKNSSPTPTPGAALLGEGEKHSFLLSSLFIVLIAYLWDMQTTLGHLQCVCLCVAVLN